MATMHVYFKQGADVEVLLGKEKFDLKQKPNIPFKYAVIDNPWDSVFMCNFSSRSIYRVTLWDQIYTGFQPEGYYYWEEPDNRFGSCVHGMVKAEATVKTIRKGGDTWQEITISCPSIEQTTVAYAKLRQGNLRLNLRDAWSENSEKK